MEYVVIIKVIFPILLCLVGLFWGKQMQIGNQIRSLGLIMFVLPFCTGGFDFVGCTVVSICLVVFLWRQAEFSKGLNIRLSDSFLSIALLTISYGLAFLGGADHGMAVWGIVRYFPILLFVVCLMQLKTDNAKDVYQLVPLSAVIMTLITCVLQYVPALTTLVTVDGRLAGFFEYPNTFAAFLITALVICDTEPVQKKWNIVQDAVLVFGVFQSGSRTGFLVLLVILSALMLLKRDKHYAIERVALLAACIAVSIIVGKLDVDSSVDRYLTISGESSTLLGRFLYFSDALNIITKNPFGLGYLGYHAIQGGMQTGVYDVVYVHNGVLQLLIDVGWVPALMFIWTVLKSFFSKRNCWRNRLIILTIMGHSLMDFDLEFLSMWLLLLPALDYGAEKPVRLKLGGKALPALGILTILVCGWLTLGDCLFRVGKTALCLTVTPFHTQALEHRLAETADPQELDEIADQVLELKPTSSIAHSAKANVAYAKGDIDGMILSKQKAIENARYQLVEYCDYFNKLYEAMNWYLKNGDIQSAQACAGYLCEIPGMLGRVKSVTSPLAWKLNDKPELELPEEYRILLAEIAGIK